MRSSRMIAHRVVLICYIVLLALVSGVQALPSAATIAAATGYALTVATAGTGTINTTPLSGTYTDATVVPITATTAPDTLLLGWTVDGEFWGWVNPMNLPIDRDRTVSVSGAVRPQFADLAAANPAAEAVAQLAARDIVRGYGDGRFGPEDQVLRAQMAGLITRALDWDQDDFGNRFTDQEQVDAELWRNVGTLAHYDVARGYADGTFHPTEAVVQAQTISFITRAMIAKGYWQAQSDDGALFPGVPVSSGHRGDLSTYVHYAALPPDTAANTAWAGWDRPASRAWCARALWLALDSHFGGQGSSPASTALGGAPTTGRPTPVTPTATTPRPTVTASPPPTATRPPANADVTVRIDRSRAIGISQLATGVTHTKEGLGTRGDPTAIARAKGLLGAATSYQNRHIYGWGARNPNPAPGVYDWTDLDAYVASMRSMNAIPVLTLAMAPDWMTNAPPNSTGEPLYNPFYPPTPAHYADFAELARQIARRYPDVKHYQVWNEMKGFTFPYTEYTPFYNAVYDALKGVDPIIQVGGFYLTLTGNSGNPDAPLGQWELDLFDTWLRDAHGADFVCLDGALSHFVTPYDGPAPLPAQLMSITYRYEAMTRQIRARTALPLWWSEDYLDPNEGRKAAYASDAFQAAGLASNLYHELLGGAAVSLRWGPIGNQYFGDIGGNANIESLLSPVERADGGQPYPNYAVYLAFHQYFGPGTSLYAATSSSPDLEVLAQGTAALLINKRDAPMTVSVNGTVLALAPYEVRLLR